MKINCDLGGQCINGSESNCDFFEKCKGIHNDLGCTLCNTLEDRHCINKQVLDILQLNRLFTREEIGILITALNNWISSYHLNPNTQIGEQVYKLEKRLQDYIRGRKDENNG